MTPFEVPMFESPFRRYSADEADRFARRTGWIDDKGVFDPDGGIIQSKMLDWLKDCELITMQSPDWGDVMGAWVLNSATNRLTRLDGSSGPIHATNAKVGIQLNSENVISYLGYFCTFVHGDEGMFGLVGSDSESILPPGWPKGKYAEFLKPAKLVKEGDDGFHVEASVFYSDAVFWSHFLVKRDGMCEMLDDEPQAAELGMKIPTRLKFEEIPVEAAEEPAQPDA
ncbi:hypothetical protein [uncultured Roseobacter sp.]|uniref:hypothetical protein n=1 Tax=uncultured Roseobacter sp. TaxID=114847 RepID=UPI00261669B3|nr:hypothetical protein [uncultured Roseobacter sp.]